jgi:hypothetical protein
MSLSVEEFEDNFNSQINHAWDYLTIRVTYSLKESSRINSNLIRKEVTS